MHPGVALQRVFAVLLKKGTNELAIVNLQLLLTTGGASRYCNLTNKKPKSRQDTV
jgi:hypothetical protein